MTNDYETETRLKLHHDREKRDQAILRAVQKWDGRNQESDLITLLQLEMKPNFKPSSK